MECDRFFSAGLSKSINDGTCAGRDACRAGTSGGEGGGVGTKVAVEDADDCFTPRSCPWPFTSSNLAFSSLFSFSKYTFVVVVGTAVGIARRAGRFSQSESLLRFGSSSTLVVDVCSDSDVPVDLASDFVTRRV